MTIVNHFNKIFFSVEAIIEISAGIRKCYEIQKLYKNRFRVLSGDLFCQDIVVGCLIGFSALVVVDIVG